IVGDDDNVFGTEQTAQATAERCVLLHDPDHRSHHRLRSGARRRDGSGAARSCCGTTVDSGVDSALEEDVGVPCGRVAYAGTGTLISLRDLVRSARREACAASRAFFPSAYAAAALSASVRFATAAPFPWPVTSCACVNAF